MDFDLSAEDMGKIVGRLLVYGAIIAGIVYLIVRSRKNKK